MGYITRAQNFFLFVFEEIYCTDSIYSVYKKKLQTCYLNQIEEIFKL